MLSGCKTEREVQLESSVEELQSEVLHLKLQIISIRSELHDAESAVEELHAAIEDNVISTDDFDGRNWREVVEEFESSSSELDMAYEKVRGAIQSALQVVE